MKKGLFVAALLTVSCFATAQVKTVKEAKSLADSKKFDQAENLINQALSDETMKKDASTWNTAGYIQKKISEEENTKGYLKQAFDTTKMYNSIYKMFEYYTECDKLEQNPDAKGKVKMKFRKANAASLKMDRPNLINGGVFFFNKSDDANAYKFFAMYLNSAKNPMLEKENYAVTDTFASVVAYYASLAAIRMAQSSQGDPEAEKAHYKEVLAFSQIAATDKENGKAGLEFEATAYKALGDTVNWLNTLKQGIEKYPDYAFFSGHLIDYYSNSGKYDEALQFAQDMIQKGGETPFMLYVMGYLYQNKKDYEKAIDAYKRTIEKDPKYAEAYSNLGLCYCQQGLDYGSKATTDLNDPKYKEDQAKIKAFYESARPYYEKARDLKPDNKELWMNGLYTIYYNLGMDAEFKEIEKMME